ncbi:MAG: hypothetical protein C0501_20290 [Isosphaera sp.]|nr:hypothetical protein [Isosphaera sp.]
MTPHDALADGRLADALALQERAVAAGPADPAARRLLADLLAFAGRPADALAQLPEVRAVRDLRRLFRADLRRQASRKPHVRPDPAPKHAARRWRAVRALRDGRPADAVRWVDAADAAAPEVRGFVDGEEFAGLRDADDRFGSVLEAVAGGRYVWFAWEALRKVELAPPAVLLDQLVRPAVVTLKDRTAVAVRLPLVYPGSAAAGDEFALGLATDHVCPDGGPTRCVGGKLLLVGDGAEVPLAECRMVEVR